MSTPHKDPLRALGSRVLRQIARHLKIKHYYRKSPSKLRRAIHRVCERQHGPQALEAMNQLIHRFQGESTVEPQTGLQAAVEALRDPLALPPLPPPASPPLKKPLKNIQALEDQIEARRAAERKAIEEHRLRYLFSPSQFVHKGTHEEYILEKDEDIELPDYYAEQELVALPIDPYRYYVYWDFDTPLQAEVESLMKQAPDVFMLKVSDVTGIQYTGDNALAVSWEPCNPLIKEWYLNTDWHDRHVCVELGHRHAKGFKVLLRSNVIHIPPASVSSVRLDRFAEFVPAQPVATDRIVTEEPQLSTSQVPIETAAQELVGAFFESYTPTPVQFNPIPPARSSEARPVASPPQPVQRVAPPAPQATAPAEHTPTPAAPPVIHWRPAPSRAVFLKPPEPTKAEQSPEQAPATPQLMPTQGMDTHETEHWLSTAGGQHIQQWLGLPYDVRWFSDFPAEALPLMFEQWITDPYDQALMISYAIWPWEVTEYLPLGASDWTLQKFLGASLFSWFRPAGSERMIRWQTQPGGSEKIHWLRPQGASEQHWSGSLQPLRAQSAHPWESWPPAPPQPVPSTPPALSLASGSGYFRA